MNIPQLENCGLGNKSYSKGQIIQHKGDLTSRLYYVNSGIIRSYDIDKKGKTHIFSFASKGGIIYDPKTIRSDKPSALYIDAIENSKIEIIKLRSIYPNDHCPLSEDTIIQILNTSLCKLQSRIIKMMSLSTYERYEYFLLEHPEISCRIPQWMIASYLGITPEALSNIKGRVYREMKSA